MRNTRRRNETRQRLIRAGLVVFAERGIAATTIGEVAAQADVVAGTFYNYFPAKADLVSAIVDELRTSIHLDGDAVRLLEGDPAGRVALAALTLLERSRAEPGFGSCFGEFLRQERTLADHLRTIVQATLVEGVAHARFRVEPSMATTDAILDLTAGALHRAAHTGADGPSGRGTAALLLALLGLTPEAAEPVLLAAEVAHASRRAR